MLAPCAGQCLGDTQTDAAGGAGNEGGFTFQHASSFTKWWGIPLGCGHYQTSDCTMAEPTLNYVPCADANGPRRMAYWQWGAADAAHTVVCVHGLSRQGRDFDVLAQALVARASQPIRVVCPDVAGTWPERLAERPCRLWRADVCRPTCWVWWHTLKPATPGLGGYQHGRPDWLGGDSRMPLRWV